MVAIHKKENISSEPITGVYQGYVQHKIYMKEL